MGQARVKDIGECGQFYVRELEFVQAGDTHDWERHYYDHLSLVTSGLVRVEWQNREATVHSVTENPKILVPANERHRIVALQPYSRSWCIFTMNGDPRYADSVHG